MNFNFRLKNYVKSLSSIQTLLMKTKLTNNFLDLVKKSDLTVKTTVNSMSWTQHTNFALTFLSLLTGLHFHFTCQNQYGELFS